MSEKTQRRLRDLARKVADPTLFRKIIKGIWPTVQYPPRSYRSIRRRFKRLHRNGVPFATIEKAIALEKRGAR